MLGIDDPYMAKPKPYRNYYCANPGDPALHELASLGMVVLYSSHGSYEWFATTSAGRHAAEESQKAIRHTKAKRIYARWLSVADAWPDLTFKRFLTDPQFADTRRSA
jgi:hypothetical protein